MAELKIEVAAAGDVHGVVRSLRQLREEGAHLLFAFQVELLALKAHAAGLVHGPAHLYAHEHVLVVGVLFLYVVGVVGEGQGYARLPVEADEALGGLFLLPEPVVLYLQIKVLRAEEPAQLQGLGLGGVVVAVYYELGYGPGQAAGEADEALAVLMEQLPVYPGLYVKALGKGGGDQIAQVAVARLVLAQEYEVGVVVVQAVLLLVHAPG